MYLEKKINREYFFTFKSMYLLLTIIELITIKINK